MPSINCWPWNPSDSSNFSISPPCDFWDLENCWIDQSNLSCIYPLLHQSYSPVICQIWQAFASRNAFRSDNSTQRAWSPRNYLCRCYETTTVGGNHRIQNQTFYTFWAASEPDRFDRALSHSFNGQSCFLGEYPSRRLLSAGYYSWERYILCSTLNSTNWSPPAFLILKNSHSTNAKQSISDISIEIY